MIRKLAASIAAALLIAIPSFSQQKMDPESVRLLKEDMTRAGVNTNSYEVPEIKDSKVPKGYKPFYISHYGRHGARYAWQSDIYEKTGAGVITSAFSRGSQVQKKPGFFLRAAILF